MKFLKPIVSAILLITGGFLALNSEAAGPESLPLVQKADLEYLGAFRLPRGGNGTTEGFSFGGNALAFDASNNSLYVSTRESWVGKVKIPTPAISASIDSLPFATMIQNIRDPLEGGLSALPESSIRGLLVSGGKLYGAASIYYDASISARVSHFSRSTDLSAVSATPLKALWQAEKSGYVGGWLASVPQEWQTALGGNVLSGNCCMPIVSRTSNGPSAFAWNTSNFASADPVPAAPLLYYTLEHATLGPWEGANQVYGGTTVMGGMAIPNGTRSLLYFGLNGTGTFCYGNGTNTESLAGTNDPEGHPYCYDPLNASKGQHAYPYNYEVWAYDLNDLAAVKAGAKNPWDVKPYATWTLALPNSFVNTHGFGGVAYDPINQIIYVSQAQADTDGYSSRSLIHAYKVKTGTAAAPAPYATPYAYPTPAYAYPTPEAYATPYAYEYQTPYGTPYAYPAPAYGYPTPSYAYPAPSAASTSTTGTTTVVSATTTATTTKTTVPRKQKKLRWWEILSQSSGMRLVASVWEAIKAIFR